MTKTDISKYVVNVQGKDFVTFAGLLAEAHAIGLKEVTTELVNTDLTSPVVRARTVFLKDGVEHTYTGYGDANVNNVGKMVSKALLRMAETRAIARAFRFACNVDMTALEEIDASSFEASDKAAAKVAVPVTASTTSAIASAPTTPKKVGFVKPAPALTTAPGVPPVANGASNGALWD